MKGAKVNIVPVRLTVRELSEVARLQKKLSGETGVEWSRSDVMRAGLAALKEKAKV